MHLDIKHDAQRVWVEITGCVGRAIIEATFIADHQDVVKFDAPNGIVPYNGNGVYSFKVNCSGTEETALEHVGHGKAVSFKSPQKGIKKVTKTRKQPKRTAKTVSRQKEIYDLGKLNERQIAEMAEIVGDNDLQRAMKFYRRTEIGTKQYCCQNIEVLMNMRDTLNAQKDSK